MNQLFTKRRIGAITLFTLFCIGLFTFYIFLKTNVEEIPLDNSPKYEIVGSSVEGRKIEAYTFGNGETQLLFVGGIHGGYEWNSVLLAHKVIDYLKINSEIIPENINVTIIPSANPDGIFKITQKEGLFTAMDMPESEDTVQGRFNANEVDLNRNFDCKWQPESTWRNKVVSAGTSPFSEPEAQAIRDFVLENNPQAVIFWHSQANTVYASECENGVLPETLDIMNAYAKASGYKSVDSFDAYEVTGDAEGWLASINIPAITVELKTHESIDWTQNLAGINALFEYYNSN
ncbi:MAG: succinylglutamate desuccinylase/aspartoacylase family protein [Candidatus Pacebacteria bacterium]|nr:succinylglutamate desuccinylase/aspartoacylase family protein [Candidatus Paceibacterota bacterium]